MLLEKTRQECFILIALDKYLGKLKRGNTKNLLHVLVSNPLAFRSNALCKT